MIIEPVQQQPQQEVKSQVKSEASQNKIRHQTWLMLQCQFWIYHIFIACVAIYIISQIAYVDQQANSIFNTDQYKYATQAITLWNKGYIIDIKQVNTDNCPQGYTELISYYWPGTMDGCYCRSNIANHATQYILQGSCSSQLISYGCNTLPALSKQNMKMWKGTKLLCYKRVNSVNFYNSSQQSLSGSSTVLKNCSQNQTYQSRTLPQISCPISSISNQSLSSASQTVLRLDTINNLNMYFISQQNYPIADFKLTEYSFCPFFNQSNISPNKNGNYILEIINNSVTCSGSDPRIVQFDYMTQQGYFTNNTIEQEFTHKQIHYLDILVPRLLTIIAWDMQDILHGPYTADRATKHLQFSHITSTTKLILYVGVPCLVLISFLVRILYIIRHVFELKSKRQYNMVIMTDQQIGQQIPNLNITKSFKKQLFFFLIQIILVFGVLVVLSIGAYYFTFESVWIKQMFSYSCTSDHLNWIFRLNQNIIDVCAMQISKAIMFGLIILVVQIINFAIRLKKGDLKQTQMPPEESLSNEALVKNDIDQKNKPVEDSLHLQDSSDIILNKQKQQLKIYDLDNFMSNQFQANVGQTGLNFYSQSIEQQNFQIAKKKKKKGIKRKNLFKEGEQK